MELDQSGSYCKFWHFFLENLYAVRLYQVKHKSSCFVGLKHFLFTAMYVFFPSQRDSKGSRHQCVKKKDNNVSIQTNDAIELL